MFHQQPAARGTAIFPVRASFEQAGLFSGVRLITASAMERADSRIVARNGHLLIFFLHYYNKAVSQTDTDTSVFLVSVLRRLPMSEHLGNR